MAAPTFWITEYNAVQVGAAPVAAYPSLRTQAITPAAADTTSLVLTANTYLVRLCANVDVYYDIGTAPTSATPLPMNVPEYIGVIPGHQVSVKLRT